MKILFNILVVLFSLQSFSQTSTKNYVKTSNARQATSSSIISSNSKDSTSQSVQYFDGLGRPAQTVVRWGSASSNDIITPIQYDPFGRQVVTYLPYVKTQSSANFDNSAINAQNAYYDTKFGGTSGDYAFSEVNFENSPLNRVLEQASPGSDWRLNGGATMGFSYDANTVADNVKLFKYDDLQVSALGFYPAGELSKTTITDEDGNPMVEFLDKRGRTILKKSKVNGSDWAETYYIYDENDRLRFVIPPQANKSINDFYTQINSYTVKSSNHTITSGEASSQIAYTQETTVTVPVGITLTPGAHIKPIEVLTSEFLDIWAFQYEYDGRNRMISKQVPGAEAVYMVYDQWDRLVLTQDGNQRTSNEWLFTKYDAFNRPVITGKKVISGSLQTIRNAVGASSNRYETNTSGPLKGYTNLTYPNSTVDVNDLLTVTYYDNYDFVSSSDLSGTSFQQVYTTSDAYHILPAQSTAVKGQVTGTLTRGEGSDFITSIAYYDDKYRSIQMVVENHLGGTDVISNQYDFVGNIRKTQTAHNYNSTTTTIKRRFTYDHMNRLLKAYHEIDSNGEQLIAENTYNKLGELVTKDLHAGEQEINYTYNIRGWLTSINDPDLSNPSDLFGMELYYNVNNLDQANTRYNGNISGMKWSDRSTTIGQITRAYNYQYDGINRLQSADHITNGTNTSSFDVDNLQYDLNGNILTLDRRGKSTIGYMDDLSYSYTGNQLMQVDDSGDDATGFTESTTGPDYSYDANGNMISDANKGITDIDYNHLNLPVKVTFDAQNYIDYLYDAAGIKLQQKVYKDGSLEKTTDYMGEFIYEDGNIQLIQHEEGRIVPKDGAWDYQYHLKDHLGNVRVTFSTTLESYDMLETFETGEESGWQNLHRHVNTDANTTPDGNEVERLQADQTGAMLLLSVNVGDTINMNVNANYESAPTGNNFSGINPLSLFSQVESVYFGPEGVDQIINEDEFVSALNGMTGKDNTSTAPRAFLNYILFDLNMDYVTSGFQQISTAALGVGTHENISISDIVAQQEGYILLYLSNENQELVDVYFDDFSVHHGKTKVVSAQNYYPFGLQFNSYTRTASTPQNFKYNNKELQEETGWLDYGARMYQPELGRFFSQDRYAFIYQSYSPYIYSLNNPIRFEDVAGEGPGDRVKVAKVYLGTSYSQAKSLNQGAALRTAHTKEANRYLDCSELVYRVLAADGVTDNVGFGNTASLVNHLGNDEKYIQSNSPEVGDIFLWRNSEDGHTGVVTGINKDEDGNIISVEITHAKGSDYGTVTEVKSLDSFTSRSDWKGFFRPKEETEDGKVISLSGLTATQKINKINAALDDLAQYMERKAEQQQARMKRMEERRKRRRERQKEKEEEK